jgi:hypothetical protein
VPLPGRARRFGSASTHEPPIPNAYLLRICSGTTLL